MHFTSGPHALLLRLTASKLNCGSSIYGRICFSLFASFNSSRASKSRMPLMKSSRLMNLRMSSHDGDLTP